MEKFVIIVAGGTGRRMFADIPKQFIPVNGKPLLFYSLQTFFNAISEIGIILAIPEDYIKYWTHLCKTYKIEIPHQIVVGGGTRFESVKKGLNILPDNGLVAIHDGVRPLVSDILIKNVFQNAMEFGNAVPAIPIDESVRLLQNGQNRIINRSNLRIIQTPQCFKLSLIKEAYQQNFQNTFTDDASVLEKLGVPIHLIEGLKENIKITYPDDLLFAEVLLSK